MTALLIIVPGDVVSGCIGSGNAVRIRIDVDTGGIIVIEQHQVGADHMARPVIGESGAVVGLADGAEIRENSRRDAC